jgi:hypothetical protein
MVQAFCGVWFGDNFDDGGDECECIDDLRAVFYEEPACFFE